MEYLAQIHQLTTQINEKIDQDPEARIWIYKMITHSKEPAKKMPKQITVEVIALMDKIEQTLYKYLSFKLNGDKTDDIQWQ